ncbi:YidB family protein [uncultured Paenalcaligenes sp.]|uniref:YidB family protein n=1 Tax=uncultured Paenalcaligenes sp. TaxID=1588925 RepID=UPI002607F536|nr:YidB family protein [uncultured Paenalcaligenes sp.]
MSLLNSVLSAAASMALGKDQKEQASLLPALLQALNQYPGGINGLVDAFKQGGLGAVVASWMGQGQNLPVEPSQLEQVLGTGMLSDLAEKSGLNQSSVLNHLTNLLPVVVDKVFSGTGNGTAPAQLDTNAILSSVLGMLAKK